MTPYPTPRMRGTNRPTVAKPTAPIDRMPERFHGQLAVQVFDEEQATADDDREHSAGEPEDYEGRKRLEARVPVRGHTKQRAVAEQRGVHATGDRGRHDQRHERSGGELEQKQFDREHDRGERCAERGRHARPRHRMRGGSCARTVTPE